MLKSYGWWGGGVGSPWDFSVSPRPLLGFLVLGLRVWGQGLTIEKKKTFTNINSYHNLWEIESRNNDDISCQIIWILLSLITNQAWLCLTLSLSSLTFYTSFNKRQCVVCSGLFLPFPDDMLSILLKLILSQVARAAGLLSPWSNIRKLNHVVINDPGSSALRKELEWKFN